MENKSNNSPHFDRSDFMSLLAVLISIGAFAVSIYEARILKEQQALMQDQQKAAVWPYVEPFIRYNFDSSTGVTFSINNKGVGPARIEQTRLSINGEKISEYQQVIQIIQNHLPANTGFNISYSSPGGVLSADEEKTFLSIIGPRFPDAQKVLSELKVSFEICYCSIYGDCWTISEKEEEPIEGCELK